MVAALLVTIGCGILSRGGIFLLGIGLVFVVASTAVRDAHHVGLSRPIRLRMPTWNGILLLSGTAFILAGILVVRMLAQLRGEQLMGLLGKWYFTGTLWLLFLWGLAVAFVREKAETQEGARADREDAEAER